MLFLYQKIEQTHLENGKDWRDQCKQQNPKKKLTKFLIFLTQESKNMFLKCSKSDVK